MKALVVYESMWGNTEKVARAIAAGLGEAMEVELAEVGSAPVAPGPEVRLIVAGGPTHAFSMSRTTTRKDAIDRGAGEGEPDVGLRDWLDGLPTGPHAQQIATFDTRVAKMRHLPGSAAKAAAKVAHRHGVRTGRARRELLRRRHGGPLLDGELVRAAAWGREIGAGITQRVR